MKTRKPKQIKLYVGYSLDINGKIDDYVANTDVRYLRPWPNIIEIDIQGEGIQQHRFYCKPTKVN